MNGRNYSVPHHLHQLWRSRPDQFDYTKFLLFLEPYIYCWCPAGSDGRLIPKWTRRDFVLAVSKKKKERNKIRGLLVGGATDPAAAPSATPPRRFIRGNATGARTHCSVSRRSTAISSAIYQCEVPATSPPLLWLCFLFLFLFLFFCFFHFDNILLHKRERDTHKVQHASFWGEPARITSPCLRLICSWPSYPVQDNFEEDWDRCWWVQLHFVRAAVLINRTKSSSSSAGPIFPIQLQPSVG